MMVLNIFEDKEERLKFERKRGLETIFIQKPIAPSVGKPSLEDLLEMCALLPEVSEEASYIGTIETESTLLVEIPKSVTAPKFIINNTSVWDFAEFKEDVLCITCLLPSAFREEVKNFRKIMDDFGYEHRNEVLVFGWHYNISREVVEEILESLNCEVVDLPIIVLSNKRLDKMDLNENIVVLKGELMNTLLELPPSYLKGVVEKIYLKVKTSGVSKGSEEEVKRIIKEEVSKLQGIVNESLLEKIKKFVDVGITVVQLTKTFLFDFTF